MTEIKIKATDTQVSVSEKSGKPTSGGINQIKCSFELSEKYNNLIVRAIFNDKAVTVINGECYAPVLAEGRCIIGVYAYAVENGKTVLRLSPEPCVMYIYQGSYSEEIAESETPSPSELEKYYSQIKDLICDTSYKINNEGYLIITQADGTEINAGYAIGADGKSAYEIAVENGYIGTEAEWLESLKGKSAEILDYSITTSKLANKSVTLDKIADGIIPDIENIKMLFFINNENDFNTANSKLFDDEGNIALSQGESAILIISQNLDEIGCEKGIICIDSEGNANYVTTTVDDLTNYLTKSDVKPMFDNLKYKLVFSTTITKEVAYVLQGGLKLKDAFVVVYGKGSENNDGINATTIFSVESNSQALTNCSKLSAGFSVFSVNDNVNYLEANVLGNKIKTIASYRYSPTEIRRVLNGCENIVDGDYIKSIMVGSSVSNAVLGVGTLIEIWGIEADEG